jgi:hypothetical protein
MDVAFAADGRRVTEPCRDLFDRGAQVALGLGGAVKTLQFAERRGRQNRSRPGAEVFRGDVLAGDFSELIVHVSRCDVPAISFFVDILNEFLARKLLAGLDDRPRCTLPRPAHNSRESRSRIVREQSPF